VLGDGVMFHLHRSGAAIVSGLELVEQTERVIALPARIGINAGSVIVQEATTSDERSTSRIGSPMWPSS
jgi:class 3 adenylate cyclase